LRLDAQLNRSRRDPEQQLADVILRLRNEYLDREISKTTQKANRPDIPDEKKLELLRIRQELRDYKRAALEPIGG